MSVLKNTSTRIQLRYIHDLKFDVSTFKGIILKQLIQGIAFKDYQWRSQPDNLVPLCKLQSITIFISLEIDCFHSQSTVNICIAGLNRRAGYATEDYTSCQVMKELSYGSEFNKKRRPVYRVRFP